MTRLLNIEVFAGKHYTMGDAVKLSVIISNPSNDSILINKPVTSRGFLRYDFFSVKTFEEAKSYHGALFYSSKETSLLLEPANNFNFNISLAKEYLLDESGNYSLELKQTNLIFDNLGDYKINIPKINFVFSIEEQPPIITYLEITQKLSKSNIKCESFGNKNCIYNAISNQELNDTQEAHYAAENYLSHLANNLIEPLTGAFKDSYELMFCKSNISSISELRSKYQLMHNYMQDNMQYWLRASHCDPGDFGYIFPAQSQKNIYLCDMYDKAQTTPTPSYTHDTKAGVIIHEVSHKATNSSDHFYSYEECETQALICDPATLTNADCLQIFAELAALQSPINVGHDEL